MVSTSEACFDINSSLVLYGLGKLLTNTSPAIRVTDRSATSIIEYFKKLFIAD
jgi:hypothetical protein